MIFLFLFSFGSFRYNIYRERYDDYDICVYVSRFFFRREKNIKREHRHNNNDGGFFF